MRHGAFDYLTKPHELEELVAKLNEAVQRMLKDFPPS